MAELAELIQQKLAANDAPDPYALAQHIAGAWQGQAIYFPMPQKHERNRQIIALYAQGVSVRELTSRYKLSRSSVTGIIKKQKPC